MGNLYISLAQVFGPLVQIIHFFFIGILVAWCIAAAAFWGERKLVQTGNRILWMFSFLILASGLLYGALRFSGQLLYPTDGWDPWGGWHYTNQSSGMRVLFTCGCLLIGATLALRKEKSFGRTKG